MFHKRKDEDKKKRSKENGKNVSTKRLVRSVNKKQKIEVKT